MLKYITKISMLKIVLLVMVTGLSFQSLAQSAGVLFVQEHKKTAIVLMKRSGIPASIILGVAMVESAMGKSRNCKLLNNYFGVKGKNHLQKSKSGHRSAYKQYPSAMASFKDFVRIVSLKKYYPALKGDMTYKKWLIKMNQYGYAEARGKWIRDVELMIKKYELDDIDQEDILVDDDNPALWGIDSTLILLQE